MTAPISQKIRNRMFNLFCADEPVTEISRTCSVHRNTVYIIRRSEKWDKRRAAIRNKATKKIEDKAVFNMVAELKGTDIIIRSTLASIIALIKSSRPCPVCGGKSESCKTCGGAGIVTGLDPSTKEFREMVRLKRELLDSGFAEPELKSETGETSRAAVALSKLSDEQLTKLAEAAANHLTGEDDDKDNPG